MKTPWAKCVEYMSKLETSPHIIPMFIAPHVADAGIALHSKYHSSSAPSVDQNEWLLNETLDSMIEDTLLTVDEKERLQKYYRLQEIIMDMCPTLFLTEAPGMFAYQSYYVKWPQAENPNLCVPDIAANFNFAQIEVFPEKRAELLSGG